MVKNGKDEVIGKFNADAVAGWWKEEIKVQV
jgi:hypothetical protein